MRDRSAAQVVIYPFITVSARAVLDQTRSQTGCDGTHDRIPGAAIGSLGEVEIMELAGDLSSRAPRVRRAQQLGHILGELIARGGGAKACLAEIETTHCVRGGREAHSQRSGIDRLNRD